MNKANADTEKNMAQRCKQQVRTRGKRGGTIARIQQQVAAAAGSFATYDRHRFAWRFLISLSMATLGTYNPAMTHAVPLQDVPQGSRDPHGIIPRHDEPMGKRAGFLANQPRPTGGSMDWYRGPSRLVRVAANEAQHELPTQLFDIPAGDLHTALLAFTKQSGLQLLYSSELVKGLHSQGVRGEHTAESALRQILGDTGLQYRYAGPDTIGLQPASRSEVTTEEDGGQATPSKPIKVPEVIVKDKKERMPVVDSPDGYKADVSSEAVLRFPASIQELPQSVSVVTKDSIHERRAITQNQALEGVAGFSKTPQYGGNQVDDYVIRGFFTNNRVPGTSRDNGLVAFNNYVADPTLYERIEVIKGPGSFTSGLVAAGGFVNRLLKAPVNQNFVVGEAGGGSYGHYRTTLDANGVMPNLPIAGRLVFTQNEDPEFFRNTGNQQFSFLPSIRFTPREDFTLTITGNVQRLRGKGSFGTPTTTQGLIPAGIQDSLLGPDNQLRIDYHSVHGEAEKRFAQGFRLKARGQYSKDETGVRYAYGYQSGGIGPDGNFSIYGVGVNYRRESFAGEVNLTKEFSLFGNLSSVAVGLDYSASTKTSRGDFTSFGTGNIANPQVHATFPPGFVNPPTFPIQDVRVTQTGAFIQGLFRPFAGTTLMAAFRQNWLSQHDGSSNNGGPENGKGMNDSKVTPQVGLSQRIIEGLNIYALYGESFQANIAATKDGSLLSPVTGQTVEFGTKWEPLGQRIRLTAALFRTDLDNIASPDPSNPLFVVGGQSQRNQGFEFEGRGALLPELQMNVAYTFLETEVTQSTIPAAVGSQAYNSPKHTVSVFGSYDCSELLTKGLKFGAVVYYRSEVLGVSPQDSYEGYTRADIFAIYAPLKWLSLQLNLNNIADSRYVEGPFSYSGYNHFGAPRHVFGMLRMTF